MSQSVQEGNVLRFRDITPRGRENRVYRMGDIDALEGGRDNLLLVVRENPKKLGTKAHRNYGLYGLTAQPSVSVADYIRSYPEADGGPTRARLSLLWDLNHSHVRIVDCRTVGRRRAA